MNEEQAYLQLRELLELVKELQESGFFTKDEIIDEITARLEHP